MALKSFLKWFREFKKIETYFGFPCERASESSESCSGDFKGGQKGVAMILAIMVVSTMFIFMADMIVNSSVAIQLATTHRNNIKAEYLAKSGKNLALFLLSMDLGLDLTLFQQSQQKPSDGPGDIWTMMNGIPIGEATVSMMAAGSGVKLSKVNDSDTIDTLESFDGTFTVEITDEQSKINLNQCGKGYASEGLQCIKIIQALMSCPAELAFLEKKKRTPSEIAANIVDWIDSAPSVSPGSPHGAEEDPYEDREPKVGPKNAPFDSLEELKLVDGWDDEMHTVFSPFFTVYPVYKEKKPPQINLNTASLGMMSCLLKNKSEECRKRSAISLNPDSPEDQLENVSSFQALTGRLRDIFCETNTQMHKQFTYRSDVFRVKIEGEVGDQVRTLSMVIQRSLPDNTIDKRNKFLGSYKFLEWKML